MSVLIRRPTYGMTAGHKFPPYDFDIFKWIMVHLDTIATVGCIINITRSCGKVLESNHASLFVI